MNSERGGPYLAPSRPSFDRQPPMMGVGGQKAVVVEVVSTPGGGIERYL